MKALLLLSLLLPQDEDARRAGELIEQLGHPEPQRREDAMRALGRLASGSAEIDRLVDEACRADDAEVAGRARTARKVRAAARLVADPEAFIERLSSANRDVRGKAVRRLLDFGPAAASLAVDLLADPEGWPRVQALRLIARSGDRRYVETVREHVGDPNYGIYALECLAWLGDETIRPQLREQLQPGGRNLSIAVEALTRLRHPDDIPLLRDLIRGDDASLVGYTVRALRHWKEAKSALQDDLKRLAAEGLADAMLVAAETGAADLAPVLRDACRRGDRFSQAAFALASLGDREAVPYLMNLVRYGPDTTVGILGLGRLRAREAVWLFRRVAGRGEGDFEEQIRRVVSEMELHDPNSNKRWRFEFPNRLSRQPLKERVYIAWALGQIGGDEAEALLFDLLNDSHENVRHEACLSLGRVKSARAVKTLVGHLRDAVAFRRIAPPDGASSVYDAYQTAVLVTESGDWAQVREAAIAALEAITGESMKGRLDETAEAWGRWYDANRDRFPK